MLATARPMLQTQQPKFAVARGVSRAASSAVGPFAVLGRPLPKPRAPLMSAAMSSAAEDLAELEGLVKAAGATVRDAKASGAEKADIDAAVATLLELKKRLPEGHELLQGGKKPAKPKKPPQQQQQQKQPNKKKAAEEAPELSMDELMASRLEKAQAMRDEGLEPFAYTFDNTHLATRLAEEFESLPAGDIDESQEVALSGQPSCG